MNPNDKQLVDALASKQMGAAPEPAAAAQPQAAPQAPAQQPDAPTTPMEKAAAEGSPTTEGDKAQADAIKYSVQFGENDTRELTPEQIASTFNRYRDLNYQNSQMTPVNEVVQHMMRKYNAGPQEIAQAIVNLERGMQKNSPQGKDNAQQQPSQNPKQNGPQSNEDIDASLKKWEEENAASLPPGYKDNMLAMQGINGQMQQMMQMMQNVMAGQQGVANAAQQTHQQASQDKGKMMQQAIANNLNMAQQRLGIQDSQSGDFQMFFSERGYTADDFVDPRLALKVMNDFKNSVNTPEMERLKAVHERRQAFTGSIGSSPSAGAAPATTGGDPMLEGLINKRLG